MKWAALVLALAAASLVAALCYALVLPSPQAAQTGMAILENYRCQPGETKRTVVRGIEDNYSPAGTEPATPHPRLQRLATFDLSKVAHFDDARADQRLIDYFEVASDTASGIVLVKFKPLNDSANDAIAFGDISSAGTRLHASKMKTYSEQLSRLAASRSWRHEGDIHWASLADLPLRSGGTLLDFITSAAATQTVDIEISDDTSVDFVAMASCQRPAQVSGVTFYALGLRATRSPPPNLTRIDCRALDGTTKDCDTVVGDTACTTRLPLLCFADRNWAAPSALSAEDRRAWSGGEIGATEPVAGNIFRTIADADHYCAARFGSKWRTAEFHLGGRGYGFVARTGGRTFTGRYWIDIRNRPYATCWTRADGTR